MPNVQIAINKVNNLGFTAFFNMIKDGKLNVVTAIINVWNWKNQLEQQYLNFN